MNVKFSISAMLVMVVALQIGCETPLVRSFHGLGNENVVVPKDLDGRWYIAGDTPFRQTYITIETDAESSDVRFSMTWGLAELIRGEYVEGEDPPAVAYLVRHVVNEDQILFDARVEEGTRGYEVTSVEFNLLGKYETVGDCRLYWVLAGDDVIRSVADNEVPHVIRNRQISMFGGHVIDRSEVPLADRTFENSELILTADSELLVEFLAELDTMGSELLFVPLPICPGELPTTPEGDFDWGEFKKEHPEMAATVQELNERFEID